MEKINETPLGFKYTALIIALMLAFIWTALSMFSWVTGVTLESIAQYAWGLVALTILIVFVFIWHWFWKLVRNAEYTPTTVTKTLPLKFAKMVSYHRVRFCCVP